MCIRLQEDMATGGRADHRKPQRQNRQALMSLEMGNLRGFHKRNRVPGIQSSIGVTAKSCLILGTPMSRATAQPAGFAPEDSALGLS